MELSGASGKTAESLTTLSLLVLPVYLERRRKRHGARLLTGDNLADLWGVSSFFSSGGKEEDEGGDREEESRGSWKETEGGR